MVLLPLVRSKTDVPIIAAGGICDGISMAAAFALGAEGIQMGTRMVSALESPVHENWKRAVVAAIGSSFSAISDRIGNYSLARLLELELQAELGYRDGVRLDLYQRTRSSASFKAVGSTLEAFLTAGGPPPDIVLLELHDFQHRYFRDTKTREQRLAQLAHIERLASRYDSLVIFYDNSAMIADGHDGLRASSPCLAIPKANFSASHPSANLTGRQSVAWSMAALRAL